MQKRARRSRFAWRFSVRVCMGGFRLFGSKRVGWCVNMWLCVRTYLSLRSGKYTTTDMWNIHWKQRSWAELPFPSLLPSGWSHPDRNLSSSRWFCWNLSVRSSRPSGPVGVRKIIIATGLHQPRWILPFWQNGENTSFIRRYPSPPVETDFWSHIQKGDAFFKEPTIDLYLGIICSHSSGICVVVNITVVHNTSCSSCSDFWVILWKPAYIL